MEDRLSQVEQMAAVHHHQLEELLGNGQPGIIDEIQEDVKKVTEVVLKARTALTVFVVLIILATMAAGSGTISLKTLIDLIKGS